jgi:hypothetical protein
MFLRDGAVWTVSDQPPAPAVAVKAATLAEQMGAWFRSVTGWGGAEQR